MRFFLRPRRARSPIRLTIRKGDVNFRDCLLQDDGLATTENGFSVTIRLPRYRSLPLSCIEPTSLRVDGEDVELSGAAFIVNGREYAVRDLPKHHDAEWFVTDPAVLRVTNDVLSPGEHEVDFSLNVRIPYVLIEGGKNVLTEVASATKRLTLRPSPGRGGDTA